MGRWHSWLFREDYREPNWMRDDFYVIKVDSEEHDRFLEENV